MAGNTSNLRHQALGSVVRRLNIIICGALLVALLSKSASLLGNRRRIDMKMAASIIVTSIRTVNGGVGIGVMAVSASFVGKTSGGGHPLRAAPIFCRRWLSSKLCSRVAFAQSWK